MTRRIVTAREQVQLLGAWRKIAEPTDFNYALDPHEPHDWQEHPLWSQDDINSDVNRQQNIIPRAQHGIVTHDWHPSIGETHVRYDVEPDFYGSTDGSETGWRATHYGPYRGHYPVKFDDDDEAQMWPRYHRSKDDYEIKPGDGSDGFSSAEEAKAAAVEHFNRTYSGGAHKPDADHYDIDRIMREQDDAGEGHKPIDDDFGDIFGDRS